MIYRMIAERVMNMAARFNPRKRATKALIKLVGVKALGRPIPTYCPRGGNLGITVSPYESPKPLYKSASRTDFLRLG
jgi:hypothetical protein